MTDVLLGISPVFILLVMSEYLWRTKRLRGERARKLVHVAAGIFIAFWPWFMSFRTIQLLSIGMIVVVLLSRAFNIFQGINGVRRRTVGDVLFPITVAIIAGIAASRWVFAVALLHLGLADGMAAVVGDRLGKKNRYKIFGEVKSIAGSLTFFGFSVLIMIGVVVFGPPVFKEFYAPIIVLLPVMAVSIENLSVRGTDNISVPLLVAIMLNQVALLSF